MPGVRSGVWERPVFVTELSESLHDEAKACMTKRSQTRSLLGIASCRGTLAIVASAQKKKKEILTLQQYAVSMTYIALCASAGAQVLYRVLLICFSGNLNYC